MKSERPDIAKASLLYHAASVLLYLVALCLEPGHLLGVEKAGYGSSCN